MKKYVFAGVIFCILTSCYVLPKSNKLYQSYSSIDLGVIGVQKKTIRKNDYSTVGIPKYSEKIKLNATLTDFTSASFKRYLKYIKSTSQEQIIEFNDSVAPVPKYLFLEIEDKIKVIDALNYKNEEIRDYIIKNPETTIVTKLKVVGKESLYKKIREANAFYLQTLDNQQQFLFVYKDDKLLQKINMGSLQTFEYDISSFCWSISDRKVMKITAIIDEGKKCKNNTARNPNEEIEKRVKKFDF